ncbi:hypothetical protein EYF80_011109 [Liparis tanakae]|uniref:Uncharacterized protein n=1 Tax=Liparis tanakae TaxID=230148 RepID=A0A4Z2ILI3_9TELE|nr:hypothetical protein EYF80_011109 [Liparis tanakae]
MRPTDYQAAHSPASDGPAEWDESSLAIGELNPCRADSSSAVLTANDPQNTTSFGLHSPRPDVAPSPVFLFCMAAGVWQRARGILPFMSQRGMEKVKHGFRIVDKHNCRARPVAINNSYICSRGVAQCLQSSVGSEFLEHMQYKQEYTPLEEEKPWRVSVVVAYYQGFFEGDPTACKKI